MTALTPHQQVIARGLMLSTIKGKPVKETLDTATMLYPATMPEDLRAIVGWLDAVSAEMKRAYFSVSVYPPRTSEDRQ